MNHDLASCDRIFSTFTFTDIDQAQPPRQRGVYVIRFRHQGSPIAEVVSQVETVVRQLRWPMVEAKMIDRIYRLTNIGDCPIIYIGSAGTRSASKNTLRGRYEEFAGRHTIMYPLWALRYFGWALDYGWNVEDDAGAAEATYKRIYRELHDSRLPALVNR